MRDFSICGTLIPGKRLGTQLGFPTANLSYPAADALPPNGVYIATAQLDGKQYVGVLNQGRHPTAPDGQPTIETHLIDYDGGDLYGHQIELHYRRYLRAEQHFPSLEALRQQLAQDVQQARCWAQNHKE